MSTQSKICVDVGRLEALEARLQSLEEHNQDLADHVRRLTALVPPHHRADLETAVAAPDPTPDSGASQDASPEHAYRAETFYYLTEDNREQLRGHVTTEEAVVVYHQIRTVATSLATGVTRGGIVVSFLGLSGTTLRYTGTFLPYSMRALGRLNAALAELCEHGVLRARTRLLTSEELEKSEYRLTPRGLAAFAGEWLSPGTLPADDFHLLGLVEGGYHNGGPEMTMRFGIPTLLRLTEEELIVRF